MRDATPEDIDRALRGADRALAPYCSVPAATRAAFLREIARQLDGLGDRLLDEAAAETALARARLVGERTRTTGQLEMFAALVDEGSWVDARIDTPVRDRAPVPKPDLRRMLVPIGPVVVFGASNFPLAFCVAGGDTASALAAGCPVVFKPHPAHPRTAALASDAVRRAIGTLGLPPDVFATVEGEDHEVGLGLVRHPLAGAVAFTGSRRAGRALWDAAAQRPRPIPVFAEMGSVNPVWLLPSALDRRAEPLAEGLAASMTQGVGQLCTKPGVVVARRSAALDRFLARLADSLRQAGPATMLSRTLCSAFRASVARVSARPEVEVVVQAAVPPAEGQQAAPVVLRTTARRLLSNPELLEEMFGPACLIVVADDDRELVALAHALPGQLTATIHGEQHELDARPGLLGALQRRVGRLVFNGFPTGLEVCPSTHHGGPYPATTDVRSTSVGTAAIHRFARPICFQDCPDALLPLELQNANPRRIWRLVDGSVTRKPVETRHRAG